MSQKIRLKFCLLLTLSFAFCAINLIVGRGGAAEQQGPKPVTSQQPAQPEDKPAEEVYKNIQTFKGLPASRLTPGMNRLTQFLGVDCAHCHVPDALDKDDKPQKQTARKMFQMVRTINTTLNTNRVTCYTCHRAQPRPAEPPRELWPTDEDQQRAAQA